MKKSTSLLLIAILGATIAQTGMQPARAALPREQTKAKGSAAEEAAITAPDSRDACSCNNSGVAKQLAGDIEGAIADFNEAIGLDPNFEPAWNNRGNARFASGDARAAIADYTHAIELDPRDATAYYNRGKAREASGDAPGALIDFNRAAQLDRTLIPPAAV